MRTYVFVFLYCLSISSSKADDILIYIRDDVYVDYQEFIDGRNVINIDNFSGHTIRRDVVDMIIAQQALALGGFTHSFKYIPGKVNFRNTKLLERGKLLISFDSYWLSDANALSKHLYISSPVIKKGEYIAGIYTSTNNTAVLAISELNDLKQFTAVSTPKWRTDWQTLSELPFKKLIREDEWLSMARMVDMQWIDLMLMPFHSSEDQTFTLDNIHLVPVEGVAIELKDSRHFVISKHHPHGLQAFKAINAGLALMRQRGAIKKAYTQAGFFIDHKQMNILNH
ncbi:hypothetical protein [Thalassotalea atypica]|uniref:hypothetical protein n=1 Tax=Thalassotalea atypica TaxID=2054316 RepID=UPI00257238CC|nr:hypothetical protein [Thalassotalea atypica]